MKVTRQCAICKKMFEPCAICGSSASWRKVVCCEDHFAPHMLILEYRDTKSAEAKTKLKEIIKKNSIDFNDNVKPIVDEMLKVEKRTPIKETKEETE